tara:strand:- start:523 stop:2646 length:2124 start_codon:yes stop_codon:yes gene_type:complete
MNRFFTLLFAASCLTAVGQESDGWCCDPDSGSFYFDSECEQEGTSFALDGFVEDLDCGDFGGPGGIGGCNDIAACNYIGGGYDFDDGTCDYECEGCRISSACNYNSSVLLGNVTLCLFPNGYCQECSGNSSNGQGLVTLQDFDNDGICDLDDTCIGGCLQGCETLDLQIEVSLDSVEVTCLSDLSYEDQILSSVQVCPANLVDTVMVSVEELGLEGGQVYLRFIVFALSLELGSSYFDTQVLPMSGFTEYGECQIMGCTSAEACNFNPEANSDDGSCELPGCGCDCENNCIAGEAPIFFYALNSCFEYPPTEMAIPDEEYWCLFRNSLVNQEGDSCLLYLNGNLVFEGIPGDYYGSVGYGTLQQNISPENFPCSTDTLVFKFPRPSNDTITLTGFWSPEDSWCGDLSYLYGCTDMQAVNYNYDVLCDDGTCIILGCTDPFSCNFSADANSDDESCDYSCCPGPGCCYEGTVWDLDLQQCIVANPSDSNFDGCVQLNDLLDLLSAYGDCGADESSWQCGDPLEYQGYDYETVQIGDQCWFSENLRSTFYSNGEIIEGGLTDAEWSSNVSGAQTPSSEEYGRLYNFYAVLNDAGLCPIGWKVPFQSEWLSLVENLGGFVSAGLVLKDSGGWNGNNETGFSALPAGVRFGNASYDGFNERAHFWSSSQFQNLSGIFGEAFELRTDNSNPAGTTGNAWNFGFSVRCIKNTE